MVDIRSFFSNLLKIDKESHKDIDNYYIAYITIKKFSDCENIHNVNLLYLIIHSAAGYFKAKNGEKYLTIDSTAKYGEVWSGIKSEIKKINGRKKKFYEKHYTRIGVKTDNGLSLNKPLKFPTLTITFFNRVKNCIHKFI